MLIGRAEAELARVTIGDDAELTAAVGVPVEVVETVHKQIIKLLNAQHHCKMHHVDCKLPQRGLGRSANRNQIRCILAFKSVIWWQQF